MHDLLRGPYIIEGNGPSEPTVVSFYETESSLGLKGALMYCNCSRLSKYFTFISSTGPNPYLPFSSCLILASTSGSSSSLSSLGFTLLIDLSSLRSILPSYFSFASYSFLSLSLISFYILGGIRSPLKQYGHTVSLTFFFILVFSLISSSIRCYFFELSWFVIIHFSCSFTIKDILSSSRIANNSSMLIFFKMSNS